MTDQLILKFPSKNIYLREDYYVSSSNQAAYDFINSWPKWIKRIANIYGPKGSGKTHVCSFLKSKTSTIVVQSNLLNDQTFSEFRVKEALVIENLDEKISEQLLFSIWNAALQDNKYLLTTSTKPINTYKFKLPDLQSRINSCLSIGIDLPNDDLISVILTKSLSDKQISIKKKEID